MGWNAKRIGSHWSTISLIFRLQKRGELKRNRNQGRVTRSYIGMFAAHWFALATPYSGENHSVGTRRSSSSNPLRTTMISVWSGSGVADDLWWETMAVVV